MRKTLYRYEIDKNFYIKISEIVAIKRVGTNSEFDTIYIFTKGVLEPFEISYNEEIFNELISLLL